MLAFDFVEPDLEGADFDEISEAEVVDETDRAWYEVDGDKLQSELEENMRSLGVDLTDDFSELLNLPEQVTSYISEQKPITTPLEPDQDAIIAHVKRILTTEDP